MKIYSRILIVLLFIPLLCSAGTPPQNVELLSIKAGQGETNAQFLLGTLYLTGRYGVNKDIEKGKYYLLIAAGKAIQMQNVFWHFSIIMKRTILHFLICFPGIAWILLNRILTDNKQRRKRLVLTASLFYL